MTSYSRDDILAMNNERLADLLARGGAIDPGQIEGVEYKGVALGLGSFIEKITWKTFKKTFYRDPETGILRGWNIRIEQKGVNGPFEPQMKAGKPICFGPYEVVPLDGRSPKPVGPGLLIHYGRASQSLLDPMRSVRDPLIAVEPSDPTLLLGWSYVDLGVKCVSTPSYFLLERDGPIAHVAY